jgi:hypothetical protein
MRFAASLIRPLFLIVLLASFGAVAPLKAQEVADTHLKAARAAIDATGATDEFDNIILQLAAALKAQLYQKNPDMQSVISTIVDETAISLAGRRADLEREAALTYTRVFSEQELNEIAAFYSSPTGKKLMSDGPIVMRELVKAAEIWQVGISRDLAAEVGGKLAAEVEKMKAEGGGAAKTE